MTDAEDQARRDQFEEQKLRDASSARIADAEGRGARTEVIHEVVRSSARIQDRRRG